MASASKNQKGREPPFYRGSEGAPVWFRKLFLQKVQTEIRGARREEEQEGKRHMNGHLKPSIKANGVRKEQSPVRILQNPSIVRNIAVEQK